MTQRGASKLSRALASSPVRRATAHELFALARTRWLEGERLDVGRLADALQLSRATAFRWVGSREALYGEVIWQEVSVALEAARTSTLSEGLVGARAIAEGARRLMTTLLKLAPLQQFIARDPGFAMQVLRGPESPVERRLVAAVEAGLTVQRDAGHIAPALGLHDLAFVIVRIAESFMYRDVLSGEPADVAPAATAIEVLVASRAPLSPKKGTP